MFPLVLRRTGKVKSRMRPLRACVIECFFLTGAFFFLLPLFSLSLSLPSLFIFLARHPLKSKSLSSRRPGAQWAFRPLPGPPGWDSGHEALWTGSADILLQIGERRAARLAVPRYVASTRRLWKTKVRHFPN